LRTPADHKIISPCPEPDKVVARPRTLGSSRNKIL
jgi:hypothetical protein